MTEQRDDQIRTRIVGMGEKVLDTMEAAFDGTMETERAVLASRTLSQIIKVLHMNQHRQLVERSQAIRLLPWLADDSARAKYMELTNPKIAPLMLAGPKKRGLRHSGSPSAAKRSKAQRSLVEQSLA